MLARSLQQATKQYGNDYSISYVIIDQFECDQKTCQTIYSNLWTFNSDKDIRKAYQVNVKVTETGSKQTNTKTLYFIVYQQGRSWYLYPDF